VLFGGLADVNPNNTWLWDGNDWHEQSPSKQPLLRYSSAASFEPHLGGVLVFGGGSGGVDLNDTWLWNGFDWSPLQPGQAPKAREEFAMAYDAAIDRIVIAGGDDPMQFFSDTWEFVDEGRFVDLGPGIGGSFGVPALTGSGDLSPGSPDGVTLTLDHAVPSTAALLLVGLKPASIPFGGGTLYPFPIATTLPLQTSGGGSASLSASIPPGVASGTTIVLQVWMFDATAPKGMSGSNGVEAFVP
jgi:hypothetical protein